MRFVARLVVACIVFIIPSNFWGYSESVFSQKTSYVFFNDPIDVVIPCVRKDLPILELCISSVKKHVKNVRRVIVVSPEKLTHNAEWVPEADYPFAPRDLAEHIFYKDIERADWLVNQRGKIGWIYQQFLKLYAPFIIPNISSNVLIVDADVVFYKSVEFLDETGAGLYSTGSEWHRPYFEHMARVLPGLERHYPEWSGICHHMLFQRSVLEDLFSLVEECHKMPAWQAFCRCIDPNEVQGSCMSEYEIYFNFALSRTNQVKIRQLCWENKKNISKEKMRSDARSGLHFVAYHAWMR